MSSIDLLTAVKRVERLFALTDSVERERQAVIAFDLAVVDLDALGRIVDGTAVETETSVRNTA